MAPTTTVEQSAPTGTWTLDPIHSRVGFSVRHLGLATFRAGFTAFDAQLRDGVLTGSARADSLDIAEESLKGHLLSPDFFKADKNPEITFTARDIRRDGEKITADGELTVAGVTRPVTASGTFAGPGPDPAGGSRVALSLEAVVDRREFGLTWQAELPGGGKALGEDVRLVADLELIEQAG